MPKYIYGETLIELPDDPTDKAILIEDLDIEDYHDLGNVQKHGKNAIFSKSQLAEMECPAKFFYKHAEQPPEPSKDAFNIGNAIHTLALEPDLFHSRFFVIPEGMIRNARNADFKAVIAEAAGRKMLVAKGSKTEAGFDDVKGMALALVRNKKAMSLLKAPGKIEPTIIWTDKQTGLRLRTRPDFLRDDSLIVDLKKTKSAEPGKFARDAFDYHYDMSVGMMVDGVTKLLGKRPDNYVFLVVEDKPPYVIEAYDSFRPWDPDDISKTTYFDAGSYRYRKALDRLAECIKTGNWPGYSEKISPMSVPGYAMKKLEEGKQ